MIQFNCSYKFSSDYFNFHDIENKAEIHRSKCLIIFIIILHFIYSICKLFKAMATWITNLNSGYESVLFVQ